MKPFSFLILMFARLVLTKDIEINFIEKFIDNERKPTVLIAPQLCWERSAMLKLFKKLTEAGIQISSYNKPTSYLQGHFMLFFVDLDCPNADQVWNESLFRSPYRWLVFRNMSTNSYKVSKLWDLPLLADSEFVLAETDEYNNITLSELHKPSPNGPTYSNSRGFYYNGTLVDTRLHTEFFRRRRDVMGHPLTMANVIQDSNTTQHHLEDRLELHYDFIAKSSWLNVQIAFQMLNATPRYIFSHRWGYKRNGQWSGMINDIETGKADLGTNCVANSERLSVVAFTDSIAKFQVKFVFRQPPLSYVANIFTLPFSVNVWVALIVSIIGSTVIIYLASKWETSEIGVNQMQLDGSIGDAMLLTMSALSQQGCSKEPKKLSGRIMLWIIFTALMALYAAYSANIVVLLQAHSRSTRNLEQLAYSKMTLAALETDYNHFVLKAGQDSIRHKIYKRIEPDKGRPQYYDLYEGVERVRKGLFAFHILTSQFYRRAEETFLETEKCDLVEIDFMNTVDPFVPIYKHSPYLELLRVAFKHIHESGIQVAIDRRMHVRKPTCSNKISSFISVSLLNISPVLFFMLIGIWISLFIFAFEILHKRIMKRNGILVIRQKIKTTNN